MDPRGGEQAEIARPASEQLQIAQRPEDESCQLRTKKPGNAIIINIVESGMHET
jgi:hypothetical protein